MLTSTLMLTDKLKSDRTYMCCLYGNLATTLGNECEQPENHQKCVSKASDFFSRSFKLLQYTMCSYCILCVNLLNWNNVVNAVDE